MIEQFALGDHIAMKKPHACGGNEWIVTRTGADVKLRCVQCGRVVMLDRGEFLRRARKNPTEGTERPDGQES